MSTLIKQIDNNPHTLSEKARRLLAAHDREIAGYERPLLEQTEDHGFRLAG